MNAPAPLNSERTSTNPWNESTPFDYAGMWIGTRAIQEHINRKISGSPNTGWIEHTYNQYLSRHRDGRCLILGANEGHVHRELRRFGFCGPIVASDIADRALERARVKDVASGLTGIEYLVADLNHYRFDQAFDFIIAEGVLHHIENIGPCLKNLNSCLTPAGQLIGVEFEGPFRFQLPESQVRWINSALAVLPMELRPLNGGVRGVPPDPKFLSRVYYVAPTEESIKTFDPSEAFSGPALKRLMPEIFNIHRKTGFGGTLLAYMTGHFPFGQANANPFIDAWLQVLMKIENTAIASGILEDEFVYYVCSRK